MVRIHINKINDCTINLSYIILLHKSRYYEKVTICFFYYVLQPERLPNRISVNAYLIYFFPDMGVLNDKGAYKNPFALFYLNCQTLQ
jgi:hypothetical protein